MAGRADCLKELLNVSEDARFCLFSASIPIRSLRGLNLFVCYLSSKYSFSQMSFNSDLAPLRISSLYLEFLLIVFLPPFNEFALYKCTASISRDVLVCITRSVFHTSQKGSFCGTNNRTVWSLFKWTCPVKSERISLTFSSRTSWVRATRMGLQNTVVRVQLAQ